MFQNGTVLRFTPDQQGRGGIKSGLHSFGQRAVMDVRDSTNVMVKLRHWEKRPSSTALSTEFVTDPATYAAQTISRGANLGTAVLHPYYLYDITDPSRFSVVRLLSQDYDSGAGANTGEHVFDHTEPIAGRVIHQGTGALTVTFTSFNLLQAGSVHVWIDHAGTPDTFAWREPLGTIHSGEAITAGVDQVFSGAWGTFTVNFATNTGNVLNDRWILVTPYVRRITNSGKFHDAEFVNIGQRCFFVSGFEEAQIYSWGTGVPQVYELGAPDPTIPLTYRITHYTATSNAYIAMNSRFVNSPIPTSGMENVKAGDILTVSTNFTTPGPQPWDTTALEDAKSVTITGTAGASLALWNPLFAGGVVDKVGPDAGVPGPGGYRALQANEVLVSIALGSDWKYVGLTFKYLGTSWQIINTEPNALFPQQTIIMLDAAAAGLATSTFDIGGTWVRGNTNAGWETFVGDPYLKAVVVTRPDHAIADATQAWGDQPPIYSYAYYDYETGHVSNIAPLLYVTEKNVSSVKLELIYDDTFNPQAWDQARYKHLIFFRNVAGSGGTALFPLGLLPVKGHDYESIPIPIAAGTHYFTDIYPDSDLIVAGALLAPRFTNGRPKVTLTDGTTVTSTPAHIAHWDTRTWLAPVDDPGLLQFSADAGQVTFGVPSESFPGTNFLRIPADDGAITGLKLVGSMLVVLTRRWSYYVAGNNETNYRLLRYSTTMPMVGPYQIAEMPSQMEEQTSSIVYFHPDGRLYAYSPGQQPQWLSEEVNDIIAGAYDGSMVSYLLTRVHVVSSSQRRGLLLFLYSSDGTKSALLYRDFESQTWSRLVLTGGTFTTVYAAVGQGGLTSATSVREISAWGGAISEILPGTPAAWSNAVSLATFPIYPDDPKRLRQIDYVRLYVANASSGTNVWTVNIYPDETSKVIVAPAALSSEALPFSIFSQAQGAHPFLPVDGATVTELVAYPTSGTRTYDTTVTPGSAVDAPVFGHRFVIEVVWPATTTQQQLLAFDVAFSEVSDQGLPVG